MTLLLWLDDFLVLNFGRYTLAHNVEVSKYVYCNRSKHDRTYYRVCNFEQRLLLLMMMFPVRWPKKIWLCILGFSKFNLSMAVCTDDNISNGQQAKYIVLEIYKFVHGMFISSLKNRFISCTHNKTKCAISHVMSCFMLLLLLFF